MFRATVRKIRNPLPYSAELHGRAREYRTIGEVALLSRPDLRSTLAQEAGFARFLVRGYQLGDQAVDFAAFFHVRQVTSAFDQVNGDIA